MADKWPYMPFYGKDFYDDSKVKVLSLGAQGLYIALLWRQWVDGTIPTSFASMAKLIGQDIKEVKKYWPEVSRFFRLESGNGINDKLEKVRAALVQKRLAQQKGAATANAKRSLRSSVSVPLSASQTPANANAIAIASDSMEGEREGKPSISYGQFLYFSGRAAQWRAENGHLYVGGDGEAFDRGFLRGVGISRADLEALEAQFMTQKETQ